MRLPKPPAATIIDTAAPFDKFFSETRYQYFLAFITTICCHEKVLPRKGATHL